MKYKCKDGTIVNLAPEVKPEYFYSLINLTTNAGVIIDLFKNRNYIILKHPYNEYSLIAHILKDSFKVKIGDVVKRGQIIAKVGNSGNTNGPHIHFQVQKDLGSRAVGIPISFKNIIIKKKKIRIFRNYIKCDDKVKNKY